MLLSMSMLALAALAALTAFAQNPAPAVGELLTRSAAAVAAGDAESGLALARQAAQEDPKSAAARGQCAAAELALGRYFPVVADVTQALTLGAPTPALYQARAQAYLKMARRTAARLATLNKDYSRAFPKISVEST